MPPKVADDQLSFWKILWSKVNSKSFIKDQKCMQKLKKSRTYNQGMTPKVKMINSVFERFYDTKSIQNPPQKIKSACISYRSLEHYQIRCLFLSITGCDLTFKGQSWIPIKQAGKTKVNPNETEIMKIM